MDLPTPGADRRFAIGTRGPYWRPGDSILAEPWVALAETNTGHLAMRCGRDQARAATLVDRWRLLTEMGHPIGAAGRVIVGAAVVTPHGEVFTSWGLVPLPGGPSRWVPLLRVLAPSLCAACGEPRWPGCWVGMNGEGCSVCLPERELDDPRPWPPEPMQPGAPVEAVRRPVARKKAAAAPVPQEVPDGQASLLDHRAPIG